MIGTDIHHAAVLLRSGKLVAIPTETVYGLAGNALDEAAVLEIYRVKARPEFDPLIIHLPDPDVLTNYVAEISANAERLAHAFWPGPLTLLLPRKPIIPDLVTSGLDHVAVRVPEHLIARELLRMLDFPLAAPSANPFGYISPTMAAHVATQLGDKIPYILDGGPCQVGVESTIVGFDGATPVIYRKGGIPIEAIEALCGHVKIMPHSTSQPTAPGMLKSHYAPVTPFCLMKNGLAEGTRGNIGVISLMRKYDVPHCEVLSEKGDIDEAARHLFAAMRRLDALGLEAIYAELVPETGLGRAINDRLRRAAAKG
jgi:L-threonylcarbamoyladenylate synthase